MAEMVQNKKQPGVIFLKGKAYYNKGTIDNESNPNTCLVTTEAFGETVEIYNSDMSSKITEVTFPASGIVNLYLPYEGWYTLKLNDYTERVYFTLTQVGFQSTLLPTSGFFFKSGEVNNLGKIKPNYARYAKQFELTKTDELITLNTNGLPTYDYFLQGANGICYDKVNLDKAAYIYIRISRNNDTGRLYLNVSPFSPEELATKDAWTRLDDSNTFPVYSYITDSTKKAAYSINVANLTGDYYIYFFNAATNNITYVYDWWYI
jgi:hypothetical protein